MPAETAPTLNEFGLPVGAPVHGWSARPRPSSDAMSGRYCRLEHVQSERHTGDLFQAYMEAPDGRDWTYLFDDRPEQLQDFRDYVNRLAASSDPLHFAIVDLATNSALGTAALLRIDQKHGAIEVGSIVFSPRLQHTRAATESMYLMMRRVFDELGYRRYEWKCDSLNAPSRTAALRYGFTFEGIFRQAIVYKGRNRDTAWYSITSVEWPRIRAAFETWLDPANFDASGMQKRRLAQIRAELHP